MIRKSKSEKDYEHMLGNILEALYVDNVPELDCRLWYKKKASLEYCVSSCKRPCKNFLTFGFITMNCKSDSCLISSPCVTCLDEIEDMKTLISAMHILNGKKDNVARRRIVSWNAWCNKMKKRLGNG